MHAVHSSTTLIIVDGLQTRWTNVRDTREGRCLLAPLGIGAATYESAHRQLLARSTTEIVPLSGLDREARDLLQRAYPTFIYDLGRRPLGRGESLREMLSIGDASLWWLLETTEKSVFRSPLVNELYYLHLIALIVRKYAVDDIVIDVEDAALQEALLSFTGTAEWPVRIRTCSEAPSRRAPRVPFVAALLARRIYMFLRLCGQRSVLQILRVPARLAGTRILLFATFPGYWNDAWRTTRSDRMYGVLAPVLNRWKRTGYLVMIGASPWEMWRRRRELKASFAELNATAAIAAARMTDLVSLIWPPYIIQLLRAWRAVVHWPRQDWHGFDVAPLIRAELRWSLGSNELAGDVVWMRAVRRIAVRSAVEFIVHWHEFQPVEKALWYGVQGSRVRTVAFQHSTASPMFLGYHFAPNELREHMSGQPRVMPLPSLIVTTGQYVAQQLAAGGFPEGLIRQCGAIRYRQVLEQRSNRVPKTRAREDLELPPDEPVIVVATTSKPADNLSMATALGVALGRWERPLTVILKTHPILQGQTGQELVDAIAAGSGTHVRCMGAPKHVPLAALLVAADALVTNSSTTGVEAMALDVLPVFFHNPWLYDLSVLYSLDGSVSLAADAEELERALHAVLTGDAGALEARKARWSEDLKALFHTLDDQAEHRMLAFLQEQSA